MQQRYFVVGFSGSPSFVNEKLQLNTLEIRIFQKCVESAWGNIPIQVILPNDAYILELFHVHL